MASAPQMPLRAAVVQDQSDGRVLMVGWIDDEALEATRRTGLVHFHSRSRNRLWQKGETSGDTLRVHSIEIDCDGDAYLIQAEPAGPTCHTGVRSCFDSGSLPADDGVPPSSSAGRSAPTTRSPPRPAQGFEQLEALWATIEGRRGADPSGSYTARLLAGGVDAVARKVVEEATEVLMAAKDDAALATDPAAILPSDASASVTRARIAEESADLVYHLLVLLAERAVEPRRALAVLRRRSRAPGPPDADQEVR